MLKIIRSLQIYVEKGSFIQGVLASLLATLLGSTAPLLFSSILNKIKIWQPFFDSIFSPVSIFFINVITIFLLVFFIININQKIQAREKEPDLIFARNLIFRKVKFGPRTQAINQRFALSVKVGIRNDIDIFDTKMTLLYMHYRQRSDSKIERHGVEEFVTTVSYVNTVHRYSFYSDELSYRTLKPIAEERGKPNYDRIIVILSGYYGNQLDKFVCKHEYLFSDISFADQTPKISEFTLQENDLIKSVDWSKFHSVNNLSNEEYKQRKIELNQILDEIYIEPDISKR